MPYSYTHAYSGDSTQLLYLRSRYYASGTGRFLTRDTWSGDENTPMSFNRWNYTQANPIIYTDPTGNRRNCAPLNTWSSTEVKQRVDEAEKYVTKTVDPIDTYVAAGIAIQCAGRDEFWNPYSGTGIAQITERQTQTEWGQPIYYFYRGIKVPMRDANGIVRDKDGNIEYVIRGYGLRCPDIDGEKILDPMNTKDAIELMKREIQLVTRACTDCTSTDTYLAAALAQNGPGFTYKDMKFLPILRPAENRTKYRINRNWFDRFTSDLKNNGGVNTKDQLDHFTLVMYELKSRGWYVPEERFDFSWNTIEMLRKWQLNQVY